MSFELLRKPVLFFTRPSGSRPFIVTTLRVFLIGLRLGLSHHWYRKFKHSLQDKLNPVFNCGGVVTTIYYLLYCPNFSNKRLNSFNKLRSTGENILRKHNPITQKCFCSFVIIHLMMWKIYNFLQLNTSFQKNPIWCSFISKLIMCFMNIQNLLWVQKSSII